MLIIYAPSLMTTAPVIYKLPANTACFDSQFHIRK